MAEGTQAAGRFNAIGKHFGTEAPQRGRNYTLLIGGVVAAALAGVGAAQFMGKLDIPQIQGFQITPEMLGGAAAAAALVTAGGATYLHKKNSKAEGKKEDGSEPTQTPPDSAKPDPTPAPVDGDHATA